MSDAKDIHRQMKEILFNAINDGIINDLGNGKISYGGIKVGDNEFAKIEISTYTK